MKSSFVRETSDLRKNSIRIAQNTYLVLYKIFSAPERKKYTFQDYCTTVRGKKKGPKVNTNISMAIRSIL